MNKISFKKIRGFLGIFLIIISLAFMFIWENYGREKFLYSQVIVLNQDIKRGQIINKDMIKYISFESDKVINNAINSPEDIIGKASKHFIPANSQLRLEFFDDVNIIPEEDEFIFKLPDDWIAAFPSSIRRKDIVYFYPVNTLEFESLTDIDDIEKIKEPIANCSIAYVKDSSNREVVTLNENERYDASAKISEIEVIATTEIINILEKYISNGYTFILIYKENI